MWKHRLLFGLLLLSSLIALSYTGEDLYLVLTVILLGILIFSAADIIHAVMLTKITQTVAPDYAVKGETAALTIRIVNRGPLPVTFMMVYYSTTDTELRGVRTLTPVSIGPRGIAEITDDLPCRYRGLYEIGVRALEYRDLFGLFSVKIEAQDRGKIEPISMLVYPKVVSLTSCASTSRKLDGQSIARVSDFEDQSSLADIRAWREGDPLRRTHWKLTARYLKLMVREFETVSRHETHVFIDCTAHGRTGLDAIVLEDSVLECAVSVCRCLLDSGTAVHMTAKSEDSIEVFGETPADFGLFYSPLATATFEGKLLPEDLMTGRFGNIADSGLIAVLHNFDEPVISALAYIAQTGRKVTAILVGGAPVPDRSEMIDAGIVPVVIASSRDIAAACGGALP